MQLTDLWQKSKGNIMGQRQFLQQMMEQPNIQMQKKKKLIQTQSLHPSPKLNQDGLGLDLKVKYKTIKLQKIAQRKPRSLGYDDGFLDTTSKTQSMKEIIDMLDFIKIKNICSVKDYQKNQKTTVQTERKVCKRHLIKGY